MKYLYIFNYPEEQEELFNLEFKYLFNDSCKNKYYFSILDIDVNLSVFIKAKIDIYYQNKDFRFLLEDVLESNLHYDDFKIIYYKNKTTHVGYKDSLNKCRSLSYGVGGTVLMNNPKHTLVLTKINDLWVFGYYHHGVPSWKKYDSKPKTFSNSLDISLARSLVNIAYGTNYSLKGIDPCCGMGTVVLEALGLGYNIVGSDINPDITLSARSNLKYFGFNEEIIQNKDITTIQDSYDVCIVDLPYNLYTPITHDQQVTIMKEAYRISKKLILVTFEEMSEDVEGVGFKIKDRIQVHKGKYHSFSRYVYVCMKGE